MASHCGHCQALQHCALQQRYMLAYLTLGGTVGTVGRYTYLVTYCNLQYAAVGISPMQQRIHVALALSLALALTSMYLPTQQLL